MSKIKKFKCNILVVKAAMIVRLSHQNSAKIVAKYRTKIARIFASFLKKCEALISKIENKKRAKKKLRSNILATIKREWATGEPPSQICLKRVPPARPPH